MQCPHPTWHWADKSGAPCGEPLTISMARLVTKALDPPLPNRGSRTSSGVGDRQCWWFLTGASWILTLFDEWLWKPKKIETFFSGSSTQAAHSGDRTKWFSPRYVHMQTRKKNIKNMQSIQVISRFLFLFVFETCAHTPRSFLFVFYSTVWLRFVLWPHTRTHAHTQIK